MRIALCLLRDRVDVLRLSLTAGWRRCFSPACCSAAIPKVGECRSLGRGMSLVMFALAPLFQLIRAKGNEKPARPKKRVSSYDASKRAGRQKMRSLSRSRKRMNHKTHTYTHTYTHTHEGGRPRDINPLPHPPPQGVRRPERVVCRQIISPRCRECPSVATLRRVSYVPSCATRWVRARHSSWTVPGNTLGRGLRPYAGGLVSPALCTICEHAHHDSRRSEAVQRTSHDIITEDMTAPSPTRGTAPVTRRDAAPCD